MIMGEDRELVIRNIKRKVQEKDFNAKVEINDPELSAEEIDRIIHKYRIEKEHLSYQMKNKIARSIIQLFSWIENRETEMIGLENIQSLDSGAIITSNHFNPLDNLMIRKLAEKAGKKRLYIVGQDTNLAMKGIIGFMMKYSDMIPISSNVNYMKRDFQNSIRKTLEDKNFILIYPEQEMWFNYRKPRPLKPGAYYYAAKFGVPIISCFTEMIDKKEVYHQDFCKVKYVLHVLKMIYPDFNKSAKENSKIMMNIDYQQKKEAYERVYNQKLEYKFESKDIAGWRRKNG